MKTIESAVRNEEPIDFTPFIDSHCHFGPWRRTFIPHALDRGRVIAEMDRFGCDMVWMSASGPGHADAMSVKNDYVFDFAAEYPDRIIPYCTLSSNKPDQCLAELKRCIARGRCIGVKMHRYYQAEYTLKTDFVQPVLSLLAEHRLVYLNHQLGEADAIEWAADKYPDVTFMEGHFWPGFTDMAGSRSNLVNNICAASSPDAIGKEVRRVGRSDTLLVGSDFALFCLAFGIGMVAHADMPEQDKRNILGLNALKLLQRTSWFEPSILMKTSPLPA